MSYLRQIAAAGIDPAMALLPMSFDGTKARLMLYSIGLQESKFEHRWQIVDANDPAKMGPARSFWQMERGGGVAGVLGHDATAAFARKVCTARQVEPEAGAVWTRMAIDDVLGAAFARLLLYTDPRPLPDIGAGEAAWQYYLRNWRPGKPHPEEWPANYANAAQELGVGHAV